MDGCCLCARVAIVRAALPGNWRLAGLLSRRRPVVPYRGAAVLLLLLLLLDLATRLVWLTVCGALPRRPAGGAGPTNGSHIFRQRARICAIGGCTSCATASTTTAACSMCIVSISPPPSVCHWRARVSGDGPVNLVKQLVVVLAILHTHPPQPSDAGGCSIRGLTRPSQAAARRRRSSWRHHRCHGNF